MKSSIKEPEAQPVLDKPPPDKPSETDPGRKRVERAGLDYEQFMGLLRAMAKLRHKQK